MTEAETAEHAEREAQIVDEPQQPTLEERIAELETELVAAKILLGVE